MGRKIILGIILLLLFILTGCSVLKDNSATSSSDFYKISSLIDYDQSLCGWDNGDPYPPNYGTKIIVKDKVTGEVLKDNDYRADMRTKYSGGPLVSATYYCEGASESDQALITIYANGYTPLVFNYTYPRGKLATVEVFMTKSCSGGPSYFDNLKISSEWFAKELPENQMTANDYIKEGEDNFYEIIKNRFGLEKTEYTLQCVESDEGRGGYIKAKGTYKEGSPLELYFNSGWCSSGGSGCGWSLCFSSPSETLFASVKNTSCNKISSREFHLEEPCPDDAVNIHGTLQNVITKEVVACSVVNDTTKEASSRCVEGEFEMINGSKKTLSIVQISSGSAGSGSDSVEAGNFNCLELN